MKTILGTVLCLVVLTLQPRTVAAATPVNEFGYQWHVGLALDFSGVYLYSSGYRLDVVGSTGGIELEVPINRVLLTGAVGIGQGLMDVTVPDTNGGNQQLVSAVDYDRAYRRLSLGARLLLHRYRSVVLYSPISNEDRFELELNYDKGSVAFGQQSGYFLGTPVSAGSTPWQRVTRASAERDRYRAGLRYTRTKSVSYSDNKIDLSGHIVAFAVCDNVQGLVSNESLQTDGLDWSYIVYPMIDLGGSFTFLDLGMPVGIRGRVAFDPVPQLQTSIHFNLSAFIEF